MAKKTSTIDRFLNGIETVGNKLPDPAILFLILMTTVWVLSWALSGINFTEIDPRSGDPITVHNLLTGKALASFLARMVPIFVGFAPLGVVLVAVMGVGVAEQSGLINTALKYLLSKTPNYMLTPMIVFVGIVSHSAVDAGYVLVIPLGGIIFHAAGRHPLAGIAAAFAGVSGGFSANPLPGSLDPLLQGFTQSAARILNPAHEVNVLCNYFFTAISSVFITCLGWYITDRIVEPRLPKVDADIEKPKDFGSFTDQEKKGFWVALSIGIAGAVLLFAALYPETSPLRNEQGDWMSFHAPIMQSIVPLIFLFFVIPAIFYGRIVGSITNSKDVIDMLSKAMSGMSYYIVMAFFCALFIDAFGGSNLGLLLAIKGANFLKWLDMAPQVTVVGILILAAFVNLFVGSASAKWALLAPIFVPMLMQVGISPDVTQAAYRVGDSSTNIITPLMPYFPLVVVFCQRYYKKAGIGTLTSMMLPFSVSFLVGWTVFLVVYWMLGIPLGFQSSYLYTP